jgi:hypothetical protein
MYVGASLMDDIFLVEPEKKLAEYINFTVNYSGDIEYLSAPVSRRDFKRKAAK